MPNYIQKTVHYLFITLLTFILVCCKSEEEPENEALTDSQALAYLESPTEWVFLFYLGGDNNLEKFLLQDIEEILNANENPQKIKSIILLDRPLNPFTHQILGKSSFSNLFLVIKRNGLSGLYELSLPSLNIHPQVQTELNMGDKKTLQEFLAFGKSLKAQKYALFLGSHGSSWWNEFFQDSQINNASVSLKKLQDIKKAIVYDDTKPDDLTTSHKLALDVETVGNILKKHPVDLVGFDACSMSSMEVAYALKNGSRFMVASIDLEPADGWNYQKVLNTFAQGGSALDLGKTIVDEYADYYKDWDDPVTSITMALLDLEAFSGNNFISLYGKENASTLLNTLPKNSFIYFIEGTPKLGDLTTSYKIQFDTSYLLSEKIGLNSQTQSLISDFEKELIVYKYIANKKHIGLSGIGISIVPNIESYKTNYQALSFFQDTIWGDYVNSLYFSK